MRRSLSCIVPSGLRTAMVCLVSVTTITSLGLCYTSPPQTPQDVATNASEWWDKVGPRHVSIKLAVTEPTDQWLKTVNGQTQTEATITTTLEKKERDDYSPYNVVEWVLLKVTGPATLVESQPQTSSSGSFLTHVRSSGTGTGWAEVTGTFVGDHSSRGDNENRALTSVWVYVGPKKPSDEERASHKGTNTGWWEQGTYYYSQNSDDKYRGYRRHCAGYISYCWGLSPPGIGTADFATLGNEIADDADWQTGDALCRPGDHVVLWLGGNQVADVTSDYWCKSRDILPSDKQNARRYRLRRLNVTQLHLTACPSGLPADGTSVSEVAADVAYMSGAPVADGTGVTFTTNKGVIGPSPAGPWSASLNDVPTTHGSAFAYLRSTTTIETATVTATCKRQSQTIDVPFFDPGNSNDENGPPSRGGPGSTSGRVQISGDLWLMIYASPKDVVIPRGGAGLCMGWAFLCNTAGAVVNDPGTPVSVSHQPASFGTFLTTPRPSGAVLFRLASADEGTATITASAAGKSVSVDVEFHLQKDPPPPPNPTNPASQDDGTTEALVNRDPNEKRGPAGTGDDRMVPPGVPLPYTVRFENLPEATASVRVVTVRDPLAPDFDWRTLRLGMITIGDTVIEVPEGRAFYTTRVRHGDWDVGIDAGLDVTTGTVHWYFRTIDPATGEPPTGAGDGFLPPEDGTGSGQGSVTFFVEAKSGLPEGTEVRNTATIVFDANEPITTNEVVNVVAPHGITGALALTADPVSIAPDGVTYSTITASVVDEIGAPVPDGTPVSFATSLGTLSDTTAMTAGGVAGVTLTSTEVGVATVGATCAYGDGAVEVTVEGTPSVSVSADPTEIPADGASTSTITAELSFENGNPVPDGAEVSFSTTEGTLSATTAATVGGVAQVTLTSGLTPGAATVTASCGDASADVVVRLTEPRVFAISLSADPTTIAPDGLTAATITATIVDQNGLPVDDGTEVAFSTTLGTLSATTATTAGGMADVTLTATTLGVATITATCEYGEATTEVSTHVTPVVTVTGDPTEIPANGTSTCAIAAELRFENGNPVPDGTEVALSTTLGTLSAATATTVGGVAQVTLTSGNTPGVATVSVTGAGATGAADVTFLATNEPPVADAGDDQTVEQSSPEGALVTLDGSGSSDPDGDALTYTWAGDFPEGGGIVEGETPTVTLAAGTTEVTLVVSDGEAVSEPDTVSATVQDTVAPVITVPADITVEESDPLGTPVTFECTAEDVADPAPVLSCDPESGSLFPLGATRVTCTAADAAGNHSTAAFVVTVVPGSAGNQLDNLRQLIEYAVGSGQIAADIEASLLAKVQSAMNALARGNANDAKVALNALKALVNEIAAQTGKKIAPDVAAELIERINRLTASLRG